MIETTSARREARAALRGWLEEHAGLELASDDLSAATCAVGIFLGSVDEHAEGKRIRAVGCALMELVQGESFAELAAWVREMARFDKGLSALLREHRACVDAADAGRRTYGPVLMRYPRTGNGRAASAFAFGPPAVFAELQESSSKLTNLLRDAQEISRVRVGPGRPDDFAFTAATQHLHYAGFSEEEILTLLPDGTPSSQEQALKRLRNRIHSEDRRTVIENAPPAD